MTSDSTNDNANEHRPSDSSTNTRVKQTPLTTGFWRKAERSLFRLLCRLLGVRLTVEECQTGRCQSHETEPPLPNFENAEGGPLLLEHARRYFEDIEKRYSEVKDKAKTVLTLVVFIASFITFASGFSARGPLLLLPIIPTLLTVWLFLEMFRLSWSAFPSMDQSLIDLKDDKRALMLAEGYLRAARFGNARTDYVASVLIASRRAVALALVSVILVLGVYGTTVSQVGAREYTRALRSNPEFLELLRGPKGNAGPSGPPGIQGPRGLKGEPGPPGENATHSKSIHEAPLQNAPTGLIRVAPKE